MVIIDDEWDKWLALNLSRRCSQESMILTMIDAGFERTIATEAVRRAAAGEVPKMAQAEIEKELSRIHLRETAYAYDPPPIAEGNSIQLPDRSVNVLMRLQRPQVVLFGDVLSYDECDALIALSDGKLSRSQTVHPESGEEFTIKHRTSEGTFFPRGENELVKRIDSRLAALLNWPEECAEGLQILKYKVGTEYRPHQDFFPPESPGTERHIGSAGQRVATLILYLNDVEAGGETIFPKVGLSVSPRKGNALYFRYLNKKRQLDEQTLHGGAIVHRGVKWIATRWLREGPTHG